MSWEQIKFNPFLASNINGNYGVGGTQEKNHYTGGAKIAQGGSAVARDIADAKRFFGAYNGTGDLRPNNAPEDSKLKFLYG